jgi:hypothetical protein
MRNDSTVLYAGCRRVHATAQRSPVENTADKGVSSLDRVRRYICRHAVVCCRSRGLANTRAVVPAGAARNDLPPSPRSWRLGWDV